MEIKVGDLVSIRHFPVQSFSKAWYSNQTMMRFCWNLRKTSLFSIVQLVTP